MQAKLYIPERSLEPPESDTADYHCDLCEGPIYEGERLFRIEGTVYCEGCIFERYGELA